MHALASRSCSPSMQDGRFSQGKVDHDSFRPDMMMEILAWGQNSMI